MKNETYAEAVTEILAILEHTEQEDVDKIPQKFMNFLTENSSKTYNPTFDWSKPINELNLKPKTEALLGLIYLRYWADEEGKQKFNKKIKKNELIYQKELREKYNPDKMFESSELKFEKQEINQEDVYLQGLEKETLFQKIVSKIKNLFVK